MAKITEEEVNLWLKMEQLLLELMDDRGDTRQEVSQEIGYSEGLLGKYLKVDRDPGDEIIPRWDLACLVLVSYGIEPAEALHAIHPAGPLELILSILPVGERGRKEEKTPKSRRSVAQRREAEFLRVARELESSMPASPEVLVEEPWSERRGDPQLGPAYAELEELEDRRHYEPDQVAETCRRDVVGTGAPLGVAEAIGVAGRIGIWGSIQRERKRLRPARDAVSASLGCARRLQDRSLLAQQSVRAAYVFYELDSPRTAVAAAQEASRHFRVDWNKIGDAKTLVDLGVLAFLRDDLMEAERLLRAALRELPKEGHTVYRSCASQGVASCLDIKGEVEEALRYLGKAAALAEPRDPRLQTALLFTAANIERREGHFSSAEAKYWHALRFYSRQGAADWVLRVSLDLSVCLVLSGRQRRRNEVRQVVLEHLPDAKDQKALRRHAELILRELSREETTVKRLEELQAELGPGGAVAF